MESKHIESFVDNWLKSQDADGHFVPDGNGYMMFKRGALSINLPVYLANVIEDYLEEYSQPIPQQSSPLDELEEWLKGYSYMNEDFEPTIDYLELLSKIQELKNK